MQVDLEPDVLRFVAEAVKQLGVELRRQHRAPADVAGEGRAEGLFPGDPLRDQVRGMVVVRRHLHGELAAGGKRGRQPGEERGVIVDPMKRGVREHDVERLGGRPLGDVAELEGQAVARVRRASLEHRARGVEPERRGCPGSLVQRARELAGAATEIDDASPWAGLDQIDQVEERGRSLSFELLVLSGIPGVGPQEAASMADLRRPGGPASR